ncbi:hypothetical protein SAY86_017894 [Trapa natans]|uniref:MLO-like protein n=1 Tax=Trapa natans TaxID=22666 RepID=A0AAN7LR39_TRANT|nr:hypothetical protein SAY86_017894 [Trapa natans]
MEEGAEEGRSLAETPTYALASVVTFMVAVGFFFHSSLRWTAKWLDRTKRKSLLAALRKIKEELMLFGLLSLLMGHWIESAAKICIKSSVSSRFYPCPRKNEYMSSMKHIALHYSNSSVSRDQRAIADHRSFCPEGHESFASYESLEQIHRLLLVLAVIHVSYSLGTLALAMIKAVQRERHPVISELCGCPLSSSTTLHIHGASTKFLSGCIPLWIYAIVCIFLDFHGCFRPPVGFKDFCFIF